MLNFCDFIQVYVFTTNHHLKSACGHRDIVISCPFGVTVFVDLFHLQTFLLTLSPFVPVTTLTGGWSGGAMVLGKLPVPGRPTIWITVGQGPTTLAVGVGGGCLDIFTLIYPLFPLSPSLWETARYRLKYCLKGPLNPNQPTNNPYWYPPTQLMDERQIRECML